MSYEMVFKDAEKTYAPLFLCSIGAWQEFGKWVNTLDEEDAPLLKKLVDKGEVKDTMRLSIELQMGLFYNQPIDDGITDTISAINAAIGVGDEEETLTVMDV